MGHRSLNGQPVYGLMTGLQECRSQVIIARVHYKLWSNIPKIKWNQYLVIDEYVYISIHVIVRQFKEARWSTN